MVPAGMFCQGCGTFNPDDRDDCWRCQSKLLVVSGPLGLPDEDDEPQPESLDEHLLERVTALEEIVRRTAESMRTLLEYLYRTERSAAISEAGVGALAELLAARGVVPESEFREAWERQTAERAEALEIRERFTDHRSVILDGFAGPAARRQRFTAILADADFHLAAGHSGRGLEALAEALRFDPDNIDLRLFVGETCFNGGDLDGALPHLDRAIELDPGRFDALVYRGVIAGERGDHELAIVLLSRAIEIEPGSPLARFALGVHLGLRGEWSDARAHLEAAMERGEGALVHYYLGLATMELGENQHAIDHFQAVLETDPGHEDALYHLGLCFLDRKWYRRARECFERAVAIEPNRLDYQQAQHFLRSGVGVGSALPAEASKAYEEAERLAAAGQLADAYQMILEARAADSENPVLAVTQALLASAQGQTSAAIAAAREALSSHPPEVVATAAYVALLESLRRENRADDAVQAAIEMRAVCNSDFARSIAWYEQAMALADSDQGEGDEALRSGEAALREAPRELRHLPLEAIGWAHYRRREFRQAVSYLERAAAAAPTRGTLTHLGAALIAAGEAVRAREILRQAGVSRGDERIEDRIREQVRRQVRLDLSAEQRLRRRGKPTSTVENKPKAKKRRARARRDAI